MKRRTEVFFTPFPSLSNKTHNHVHLLDQIQRFIRQEKYEQAQSLSMDLINLTLDGLRYFQTCVPSILKIYILIFQIRLAFPSIYYFGRIPGLDRL
jgi:hypothetical protein